VRVEEIDGIDEVAIDAAARMEETI
jgi:hypothetical protein